MWEILGPPALDSNYNYLHSGCEALVCVCVVIFVFFSVVCFTSALGFFLLFLSSLLPFSLASKKNKRSDLTARAPPPPALWHSEWMMMSSNSMGESGATVSGDRKMYNCCKSRSIQQRNAPLDTLTHPSNTTHYSYGEATVGRPIEK